jgi:AraC-like DNA-binding protein
VRDPRTGSCWDRRIARVTDSVTRDLTKRMSRSAAARLAHLEPAYFSKRFHRVMGMAFAEWSESVRVQTAKNMLRMIDKPILRIAEAVGYTTACTFERAFRRQVGVCPREYRQMILKSEGSTEGHETHKRGHKTLRYREMP